MTTKRATDNGSGDAIAGDVLDAEGVVLLSREAILAAEDIEYEYVDVPEWGGKVRVRSLTGRERDAYDAESYALSQTPAGKDDPAAALTNFRSRRVARAIVDAKGDRVFTTRDIDALAEKNAAVLDRIDDVVTRLSGMDPEAVRRAVEALKVGLSDASGSDSP